MSNSVAPTTLTLESLYANATYFDQYSESVAVCVCLSLALALFLVYAYVVAHAQPIVDNWAANRCKPYVLPLAGILNRPAGMTAGEYTSQNFAYCMQSVLASTSAPALQPLTYITSALQATAGDIGASLQSIRAMFAKMRASMQAVSEDVMGRLMNVSVVLMQTVLGARDLVGKLQGTLTACLFTSLGGYYVLQSTMGVIAEFIVRILVLLSILIAGLWAVPFTWGAAAANSVIFAAIAIPMAMVLAFMSKVLKLDTNTYRIPKLKCFDRRTRLRMEDGTVRDIADVRVGDALAPHGGGKLKPGPTGAGPANHVTAVVRVTTAGSTMYVLDGSVWVSDSHLVWDAAAAAWVRVRDHPAARPLSPRDQAAYAAREPCLYCLNTTRHCLWVDGSDTVFADWDEQRVDASVSSPMPAECGFDAAHAQIEVARGVAVPLSALHIDDQLACGERVYGVVDLGKGRRHLLTQTGECRVRASSAKPWRTVRDFNGEWMD